MHDKTNIMIQIELKEVPEKYIKKFKREYILESKKIPDTWYKKDNFSLFKYALNEFCKKNYFQPMSENEKNEIINNY